MEAVHANALCAPDASASASASVAAGGEAWSAGAACRTHEDPREAVGTEQQQANAEGSEGAVATVLPTAAAGSEGDDESPSPPMPYVQWARGSLSPGCGQEAGGEQPSGLAI